MFARVVSKARYLYLIIDGYGEDQVRFFDEEGEKKLRELYKTFYERAIKDYEAGVVREPPKPVEKVVEKMKSALVALVIEGERKEGTKTRIRLPRGIELVEGIYVLESVYGECSASGAIDFVVLRPCRAVDVVMYLKEKRLIEEKIASHIIETLGESEQLDLVDLAARLADWNKSATIMLRSVRTLSTVLEVEVGKRLRFVVRPEDFPPPSGATSAQKIVNYAGSEILGASLTSGILVAWYSDYRDSTVISRRIR